MNERGSRHQTTYRVYMQDARVWMCEYMCVCVCVCVNVCVCVCVCVTSLLPFEKDVVRGSWWRPLVSSWGFWGSGLDQTWTRLSLIQLNSIWLWSHVWSYTLQSPWISLLFIIFFYIIHDICTYQLSLKNCTRQTDILSICASVAKCLV